MHNGGNGETNLEDTTAHFDGQRRQPASNLLNLTLRNKTTGAQLHDHDDRRHAPELHACPAAPATATRTNNNVEQRRRVRGARVMRSRCSAIILDHLDELVEKVDQIAPGETDKEIPLIGISTKELVGKIQSVKQTIDELRGQPLAEIDCIADINDVQDTADDGDPVGQPTLDTLGRPFDFEILPDNTTL